MQFVRIDGVTLHYRHRKKAGAPTIAFINSIGTDSRIWEALEEQLWDDWSVLRYDVRGHGLSGIGKPPYDIPELAEDFIGLMDHLGLRDVVLCGLSIGGQIGMTVAAKAPKRVEALVLCDTAVKIGDADFWAARIAAVRESGIDSVSDGVMERWFTKAFRSGDQARLDGYRAMLTRQPIDGYLGACAAIAKSDLTETAATIKVPTLVVVGEEDGSTPPDLVRATAEMIPGAKFEVIKGAGHIPCVEQPEALAALIRDFLAEALTR